MAGETWDVVVIGAGPGGYVAAIRCAQRGLKTLCIDKGLLGGVCLNVGCIPSKALIHASKVYRKAKDGAAMGILANDLQVDMAAMQTWKSGITQKLSQGIGGLFKGNKVAHLAGTAKLAGKGQVDFTGADGQRQTIAYRHLILATGSTPIQIPGFAWSDRILDSTGALALTEVPKTMAILGGGVIGLELCDVFARLGCQCTVIEAAPQLLGSMDADVVQPVQRKQAKLGVKHLLSTKALGQEALPDGRIRVTVETAGKTSTLEVDRVLVAVGRRPNTADLGLETVGIELDARKQIPVDPQLRTKASGIWAIGDIVPGPMLAHKASKEGEVASAVIAGDRSAAMDVLAMPNVVYTDPEIATVGPSLAELQKSGRELKIGKFGFGALGRAMTANQTDGFCRVVADAKDGTVIAVQVVGAEASELIAEAGLAVEMAAHIDDIGLTVHAHPTMAEAMLEAAHTALGHPLHQLKN
jgi:dihydrolipoamide dehydrogenase